MDYFTLDHLGSISVVTNSSGAVTERDSYDPWGLRRNPDGTAASCGSITSATTRGFTNQEMMDNICFINFNARVYDPSVGRFMSADSTIPNAFDGQSYNRYSYVKNGPLSLTDPTGMAPEAPYHASPDADSSPFAQDDRAQNQSLIMQYDFVSVAVTTTQPSTTASTGAAGSGITNKAPVGIGSVTNTSNQSNQPGSLPEDSSLASTVAGVDAKNQTAQKTEQTNADQGQDKFIEEVVVNGTRIHSGKTQLAKGNGEGEREELENDPLGPLREEAFQQNLRDIRRLEPGNAQLTYARPTGSMASEDAVNDTQSELDAARDRVANRIANGHGYKHASDFGDVDQAEFQTIVRNTISDPYAQVRDLSRGRTSFYDSSTNTLVIVDPNSVDNGTMFRPTQMQNYVNSLR